MLLEWNGRYLAMARAGFAAAAAQAEAIIARSDALREVGDNSFAELTAQCRGRLAAEGLAKDAVSEAFALAREATRRVLGFAHHPVQLTGGLLMLDGKLAEMETGEGKTITALLPAACAALAGIPVHVVTVNQYLATRDAEQLAPIYRMLGLSVGLIDADADAEQRRAAYRCDVTYCTNKDLVFDYLRDRMAIGQVHGRARRLIRELGAPADQRLLLRGLFFAIVDEADSVLIDEAVTPAIIGADTGNEDESAVAHYRAAAAIASTLALRDDYEVDARLHRVRLTARGRERIDARAADFPPFWAGPRRREELVVQALSAIALYRLGDDYIIQDGQIVIVDRSTGRVLAGRKWQLGVHQSVEAKEGVTISQDRSTTARTSYQRFFQRYQRLCGMTGTGWEVGAELWRDYRLRVVRVPTHRPIARRRKPDRLFSTEARKFAAVAQRVEEFHSVGRPVLVGTRSVEASERLGALLGERGVVCRILNATREKQEAEIVALAGQFRAVTVATNMAGRGTDIKLEDATRALGGLVVLATERNDEARVDRQLFGRSGRQGDPGLAQAFASLDDALIKRHALPILVALCRRTHGPLRSIIGRLLWSQAQWAAGRKAAVIRAEVARAEAWHEMAMHHRTR
jgi:preprotein translocase subunit SecA